MFFFLACYQPLGAAVLNSDTERTGTGADQLRVKREVNREMTSFNQNEKLRILWKHNDLRSSQSSSDMMYLVRGQSYIDMMYLVRG